MATRREFISGLAGLGAGVLLPRGLSFMQAQGANSRRLDFHHHFGSPAWVQMMADVLQHRVLLSHEPELTSRGAAILALRACGAWRSLADEALPLEEACVPDRARADVYHRGLARQLRLYESLIGHDAELGARTSAMLR